MTTLKKMTCGLAVAGVALAVSSSAFAYKGQEMAKNAKISLNQAQAIAVNTRQGTIESQMLGHRKDAKGLDYSFVINSGGKMYDVAIDANTGDVAVNKPKTRK